MDQQSSLISLVSGMLESGSSEEITAWLSANIVDKKKGLVPFLMQKIETDENGLKQSIRLLGLIILLVNRHGSSEEKFSIFSSLSSKELFWNTINTLLVTDTNVSIKSSCLSLITNAYLLVDPPSSNWPLHIFSRSQLEAVFTIIDSDTSAGRKHVLVAFNYLLLLDSVRLDFYFAQFSTKSTLISLREVFDQLIFQRCCLLFGMNPIPEKALIEFDKMNELECLPTVFEFVSLYDLHSNFGRVNRHWKSVAASAPLSRINTVGYTVQLDVLVSLISGNVQSLVEICISVDSNTMGDLLEFLIQHIHKMSNLKRLEVYTSMSDGSVRNMLSLASTSCKRLILQIDDSLYSKQIKSILALFEPQSIFFLSGCSNIFPSEDVLLSFLLSDPLIEEIHLGFCSGLVDMDRVIPLMLSGCDSLKYFQWSHASASLELMQTLIKHERVKFSFDSIGFISWFAS